MAHRQTTAEKLGALRSLRERAQGDDLVEALRAGLRDASAAVVAKAAQVAAEAEAEPLAVDLASAFARLLEGGSKADPGCLAKTALVRALHRFAHADERVFLAGLAHVQSEPVYGGRKDTAGELRGVSALALVHTPYPEALIEVGELLADPELPARIGAARALAALGRADGSALLRLALAAGERDPEAVAEYTSALLVLTPERGIAFLARFLPRCPAAVSEAAALAVGAARPPGGLALLRALHESARDETLRSSLLLAIALLRADSALEFLLGLVADAPGPDARAALVALATYRDEEKIASRARETALRREDLDLGDALRDCFGSARRA